MSREHSSFDSVRTSLRSSCSRKALLKMRSSRGPSHPTTPCTMGGRDASGHGDQPKLCSGAILAEARVACGGATIQVGSTASSCPDMQHEEAGTKPAGLTSLTALPDFVSIVPVRLPFPPLPPRPPRRAASSDSHASRSLGSQTSPPCTAISTSALSRLVQEPAAKTRNAQLSCETWLQTPASRRLFTGEGILLFIFRVANAWSALWLSTRAE